MPASACLPCLCSTHLSKQLAAPDHHKPSDHPCLDMCPSCLTSDEHCGVCVPRTLLCPLKSYSRAPAALESYTWASPSIQKSRETDILPSLCTLHIGQSQCWSKESKAGKMDDQAGQCLFCTDLCCDKISWRTGGPGPSTSFLPGTNGSSGQTVRLEAKYKNNEI